MFSSGQEDQVTSKHKHSPFLIIFQFFKKYFKLLPVMLWSSVDDKDPNQMLWVENQYFIIIRLASQPASQVRIDSFSQSKFRMLYLVIFSSIRLVNYFETIKPTE